VYHDEHNAADIDKYFDESYIRLFTICNKI